MNVDNLENLQEIMQNTGTATNQINSGFHPSPDLQFMGLFPLINGDNDMISQRMLKKTLAAMSLIVKIHAETQTEKVFKLPRLDSILNYQTRKGNTIHALLSLHKEIQVPNNTEHVYLDLPSPQLKFIMSNLKKYNLISFLPDRTPGQAGSLQQGENWIARPLFQQPIFNVNGVDIWSGDIIYLMVDNPSLRFLVESFHASKNCAYPEGYMIRMLSDEFHGLESPSTAIDMERIGCVYNDCLEEACYLSILLQSTTRLCPTHHTLLFMQHPIKKNMLPMHRPMPFTKSR
ncbi:hypothetical protein PHYBLDRAFT_138983 [Phycomyces blakesleeanus NRRL 1555(-)]|uniref:Uncharacterized protein n=2 Tax=Phycomyces blakesleeanus TaxID=4837 RepID=A0A162YL23_PHYB8|nr:hypothetical protein PHYBLDRAFT_138983 [Phycomyces blakesleeanus NRRL 1555(-)]OAD81435.1 hypothetical protein PHYBLDRAFT_138983 [Phycomyces blakesleeanus NRRL 1555(-)]|eukprot:XP_018299475.1 hypothetical protein PHYBLDRAFT_138983 [Phycomyces blakesleeanus NRRL 1555(-)]